MTSIKCLETRLKMLLAPLKSKAKKNNQLCMAITIRSGKFIESSIETKITLFGESKECEREDEIAVNKRNITLCNLESERT